MQTFQTRQILAIIKTKFSRENFIFNRGHGAWKNKMDFQFDGLFVVVWNKLQVNRERRLILNLILGLPQTSCSHFSFCGRRDALQIQRLDDSTVMSISLKGVILVLKTLTVLSDQKNRPAVRLVGQFFFNYQHANEIVEDRRQRWCLICMV